MNWFSALFIVILASGSMAAAQKSPAGESDLRGRCVRALAKRDSPDRIDLRFCRQMNDRLSLATLELMVDSGQVLYQDEYSSILNITEPASFACVQTLVRNKRTLDLGYLQGCRKITTSSALTALVLMADSGQVIVDEHFDDLAKISDAHQLQCLQAFTKHLRPVDEFIIRGCVDFHSDSSVRVLERLLKRGSVITNEDLREISKM